MPKSIILLKRTFYIPFTLKTYTKEKISSTDGSLKKEYIFPQDVTIAFKPVPVKQAGENLYNKKSFSFRVMKMY
jgi:hypothetical protein